MVEISCADHLLRLISKSLGHLLMQSLHFRVRDTRQFLVPRPVRCDLRRTSTFHALLFEVGLNLLTPRTRSVEILTCITSDLRLTTLSPFDLVAPAFEAER